jgi:1-phosphatidylinositol-3-phosphate 5-kinase
LFCLCAVLCAFGAVEKILSLVREVVTNVDPDVRAGDSLDIRPYVKIKVIPGGSLNETAYVDGVVFRKNVANKKMLQLNHLDNPKILILGGGLEFQRVDTRLSSMDTLIEQENHYTELLVAKLMLLKPDLILVGKSVSRKAMELLLTYNVVVMQNVKAHLLVRIA